MSKDFEIIQLEIDESSIQVMDNRLRNQLMGCMHAHNELAVLNRVFMFGLNPVARHELADSASAVQMWCLLQVLAAKLYEAWLMVVERFLTAHPMDWAIEGLQPNHKASLNWLEFYFGDRKHKLKENPIRTIRDKTAFHYDKLNLGETIDNLALHENVIYLAQHPANMLYYLGSAAVFRTIFAMIADKAGDTGTLTHSERVKQGVDIVIEDAKQTNIHIYLVLYGLVEQLLERAIGRPLSSLEQVRIPVEGAPDPDRIVLPTFIDIG